MKWNSPERLEEIRKGLSDFEKDYELEYEKHNKLPENKKVYPFKYWWFHEVKQVLRIYYEIQKNKVGRKDWIKEKLKYHKDKIKELEKEIK